MNVASRMESNGLPNEIQVSESTYDQLRDLYSFADRGEIAVKGKGNVKAFLLKGHRETR